MSAFHPLRPLGRRQGYADSAPKRTASFRPRTDLHAASVRVSYSACFCYVQLMNMFCMRKQEICVQRASPRERRPAEGSRLGDQGGLGGVPMVTANIGNIRRKTSRSFLAIGDMKLPKLPSPAARNPGPRCGVHLSLFPAPTGRNPGPRLPWTPIQGPESIRRAAAALFAERQKSEVFLPQGS